MARWIDADALSRYFYEKVSLSHWMHSRLNTAEKAMEKTREIIENFPAADVAPVRHGRWK